MSRFGPKPRPLADRFWAKVDTSGGPDACWSWTGGINKVSGYGQFRINPKETPGKATHAYAHRIAFVLTHGPLGEGEVVDHICERNPLCCNGKHLRRATVLENALDSIDKRWRGRIVRAQQLYLAGMP